jgi:hypothetical protein
VVCAATWTATVTEIGCGHRPGSLGDALLSNAIRFTMTAIVQVEYRPGLLPIREDILQSLGHPMFLFWDRGARETSISQIVR